ncbi:hypothetical protein [Haloferula sargassicola]|uniref:hypothetical protein n=1 Tax=Haloferula sargassicola TaxID=490096 RepID=UPI0033657292
MPDIHHRYLPIGVGAVITLALIGGAVAVLLSVKTTNCGGNTAALSACRSAGERLWSALYEERLPLDPATMSKSDRESFSSLSGLSWLGSGTVLVARQLTGEDRQLVAVCDKAFDNVPEKRLGRAPFTHAVAFADGTTALLSEAEYARLDLSGFLDVRKLGTENVERVGALIPAAPSESELEAK